MTDGQTDGQTRPVKECHNAAYFGIMYIFIRQSGRKQSKSAQENKHTRQHKQMQSNYEEEEITKSNSGVTCNAHSLWCKMFFDAVS